MAHQPKIVSVVVVQVVAIDMITLFAFLQMPASWRAAGARAYLLQGSGIAGQLPSFLLEGLSAIAGGGAVHIFPKRLEIWNSGSLPEVTPEVLLMLGT